MLIYVAKLLSSMVETKKLYREKAVSIPAPRFVVFYNGEKDAPEKETLRLSAQYGAQVEEPELELKVTVYNINTDKGCEVLAKCRTLREYMVFVDRVRQGMAGINDETEKRKVMEEVVDDCIKDGILEKLLKERREEIIMVSILQYDQAAHEAALHEDGYDEGHDAGYDEGHDAGYDEGHDAGYDEGYDEGEVCIQIDLIRKKIEKGKSHQLIADEIEKEIAFVDEICSIADSISPEFDVKKTCVEYMSRHRKDEDGHMSLQTKTT